MDSFDPCGWPFLSWTILASFFAILVLINMHTFSDQHMWNSPISRPMLAFIPFDIYILRNI